MTSSSVQRASAPHPTERFDVVIVGAGISGIGCAYMLRQQCPELSFVILESMESFGGTWLLHKYPGTRSDSDLYTFGYRFKPWEGQPIATAGEILRYLGEEHLKDCVRVARAAQLRLPPPDGAVRTRLRGSGKAG